MKRQLTSITSKFVLGILLLTGVLAVQGQSISKVSGESASAVVKYLGVQEDLVLFNVNFKNPNGQKFSVIVKDQDNTQLFQRTYTDKNFDKQFKLPRADRNKITFLIRNFKGEDLSQSFAINVNTRYVEDIAIKKLD